MTSTASYTPAEGRGDVSELRLQLRDPQVEKDPIRKRDLLRKVIGLMTMGVDTSSLFSEMILSCFTTDIVSKKLIYFYLISRSENNAELALLSINTLMKECGEESPLVRALALRSLASLRLPQLFDFLIPLVKKSLSDTSPHVRKTACLCALRVFRISPIEFYKQDFLDRMFGMLRDPDPLVCCNALSVLMEVSRDAESNGNAEGVFNVTKPILYHLLNKMRSAPEWHQAQIINLVLRYTPANEEEMFDIMNLLEERLQSYNSDLILSVCHVFFHLTQNYPAVYRQVFDRLKQPLLTLVSSSSKVEVSYVVLCHIKLLVERDPSVFQDAYKTFFCHYTEPTYVKAVKIDILAMVAVSSTATAILEEFVAYALERDPAVVRKALAAMGSVALRLPPTAPVVLQHFIGFLESDTNHTRGRSLAVMKDYLRKYRDSAVVQPFLDALVAVYREMNFTDEESKVALVWVMGELGEYIEDAPYILEGMCHKGLLTETPEFRLQFLTSAVILFFKRPPEMQQILGKMFKFLINDFSHADVHDQALLYHRLLRHNLAAAFKVICSPKEEIKEFVEDQNATLRDKLFEEFNTLSVVYHQPSGSFMAPLPAVNDDDDDDDNNDDHEAAEEGVFLDAGEHGQEGNGSTASCQANFQPLFPANFELSDEVDIEPQEFQRQWENLDDRFTATLQLQIREVPSEMKTFEETLEECGVVTLASGMLGTTHKYYLYAQQEGHTDTCFLLELFLHNSGAVNVAVKSANPNMQQFLVLFRRIMEQF